LSFFEPLIPKGSFCCTASTNAGDVVPVPLIVWLK
jgi:hypothetical protein